MKIRLVQWNIWYKENWKRVAAVLEHLHPDIVCMQEATVGYDARLRISTAHAIARHLNHDIFFAPAASYRRPRYSGGNAILSRFPLTHRRTVELQRQQKSGGYSGERRVYLEARVHLPHRHCAVGTTHLSYSHRFIATPQKDTEVRKLLSVLAQHHHRYIFAGDLNTTPGSRTIAALRRYLRHIGPPMNLPTWTTKPFAYQGFQTRQLQWRLDYAFATPDSTVRRARIFRTKVSDHLPLVVDIDL